MAELTIPDPLTLHAVQGDPDSGLLLRATEGSATEISLVPSASGGIGMLAPLVSVDAAQFVFTVVGPSFSQVAWSAIMAGSVLEMAFFGEPPIARPSVTGVTTQDQVDALVDALAGLGLVTDDR